MRVLEGTTDNLVLLSDTDLLSEGGTNLYFTNARANSALSSALALKADDSAVVHNTGTETIAGNKIFTSATEIALQPSFQTVESSVYAGTSTFLADDVFGGNIIIKSGFGDIYTLCSADDIETVLTSAFGSARTANETFWITISNIDVTNSCTIASSSDFNILNGDFILTPKTTINLKFKKVSVSPLGYALIN